MARWNVLQIMQDKNEVFFRDNQAQEKVMTNIFKKKSNSKLIHVT